MKRRAKRMRWAIAHPCTCQQCGTQFRSIRKDAASLLAGLGIGTELHSKKLREIGDDE
jgi:hypothetical protein